MRTKHCVWWSALGLVAAAGAIYLAVWQSPQSAKTAKGPEPSPIAKALAKAGGLTPKAVPALERIVETGRKSRDPKVQDEVGSARIRLAYIAAQHGDPKEARATLLTAAKEYEGTGAMSADFGGIPDQAAYQAAVCLAMEKKPDAAKSEFARFIEERPLSPLVHACYRRLVRMNGGKATPEYDRLLQSAVSAQEKHIRFETSVCGPKTIEYLLKTYPSLAPHASRPSPSYKELAKLCGTTDDGTTVAGMRKGLASLGIESFGYKLNRRDLVRTPLPAILLEGDHFVALLRVEGDSIRVYDTRFKSERAIKLPPSDDPDFFVDAILFSKPEIQP